MTDAVRKAVDAAGAGKGVCLVYTPHTTCAVTVNEGFDPAVQADFVGHFRHLVPREGRFEHSEGNSDAHIKAMLIGTSVLLPISEGRLRLGRWQAVFLCEFDGPRERSLWVSVR